METAIVIGLVILAAVLLVRRVIRAFSGKDSGCCAGGCQGCGCGGDCRDSGSRK